ncbi:MAG: potassium channel family protein [Actinomycetota bacterium]
MEALAIIVGVVLVVSVLADLANTLVATSTSRRRFWLTLQLYLTSWQLMRFLGRHISTDGRRERMYGVYAPLSVLALLTVWVVQQIIGFGLIWWGLGGIDGAADLWDSIYYSGVVYFTLGFGEVVPVEQVPRFGALIEAFSGVLTTALVIGYLPALYSAYSERERKLMTLDDGTEERMTPQSLIMARSPGGDVDALLRWFEDWEDWIAGVTETHTAFPMLMLFRSKHPGQHWVTALGVVTDAALICQGIRGAENREAYWCLRRSIRLFDELTAAAELDPYIAQHAVPADVADDPEGQQLFVDLYAALEQHGFEMVPVDEARRAAVEFRNHYAPRMEYLIDLLDAPRGFWGQQVGHRRAAGLPTDA